MDKKGKTIKQLADEFGVSKQAIHQKRKKEPLSTRLQPFTSTKFTLLLTVCLHPRLQSLRAFLKL